MAKQNLTPWRRGSLTGTGGFGGFGGNPSVFDLHRQVNRLFDDMFDQGPRCGGSSQLSGTGWPQLEVEQNGNNIQVTAELPGVKEDDIELTIEDGILTVSGEKRSARKDESGYSERSYGRFERRVALPPDVDDDACEADFKDGVLTVTLPRSEAKSRGRRIPLGQNRQQGSLEAQNDAGNPSRQQAAQESDPHHGEDRSGQQA
ncbi:Hsp20/alpha crystallin family protein [Novosphingobium tardum]|uniref:Hsp20/alpha crystallin family protein n=1 Tax=Novosphingobium tardum TaxID=1538021 RepID=A0ABV8RUX9_9SPHN